MNESNIPEEWWSIQDQDDAWIKQMEDELRNHDEESENPVVFKEFDDALIGFGLQFNQKVAIYDYARCVDILEKSGMPVDVAIEHMEYNVMGAYVGRRTPIFLTQKKTKNKKPKNDGQMSFDFGGDQ